MSKSTNSEQYIQNKIVDFGHDIFEICQQFKSKYDGTLEQYLRSLLTVLLKYEGCDANFPMFTKSLQEAFVSKPQNFDEAWLTYNEPPEQNDCLNDFDYLKKVLIFQIADLKKMADAGLLNNKWKYFGIDSPSGYGWYNFDPFTYLYCGSSGLHDMNWIVCSFKTITWLILAELLEAGRLYE